MLGNDPGGFNALKLGRALVEELYPELALWRRMRDCSPRVAVIGFGKMGLLHSGIVGLLRPGSLRAVVDKSKLIVSGASRLLPGVRFYTDTAKMLRENSLDAVFVTTPTEHHVGVVKELWGNGFQGYVFVEKPPAKSLEEYRGIASGETARRTMTGFQKRFAAPYRHLRMLVERGALGRVEEVYAEIRSSDILEPTSRYDSLGRGVLLDLGIHVVDLLVWLLGGEPEIVEARYRRVFTKVDDYFEASMKINGVPVRLVATWSEKGLRDPRSLVEIRGSLGWARATEDMLEAELSEAHELLGGSRSAKLYRPHYYQGVPPVNLGHQEYGFEDMHFLEAVCMGKEPETSLPRIEPTMRLVEELYRAAREA